MIFTSWMYITFAQEPMQHQRLDSEMAGSLLPQVCVSPEHHFAACETLDILGKALFLGLFRNT